MQQSSATPSLHLWFLGVAEDCCMLSILLAVPSCFNSFWHGVIPTSYFIFNDFYTCIIMLVYFLTRHNTRASSRRRPKQFLFRSRGQHALRDHEAQVHRVRETPTALVWHQGRLGGGRDSEWKDVHHGRPPSGVHSDTPITRMQTFVFPSPSPYLFLIPPPLHASLPLPCRLSSCCVHLNSDLW